MHSAAASGHCDLNVKGTYWSHDPLQTANQKLCLHRMRGLWAHRRPRASWAGRGVRPAHEQCLVERTEGPGAPLLGKCRCLRNLVNVRTACGSPE